MACLRKFAGAAIAAALILGGPARAEDRPAAVTIGYLELVNAQLVAKALKLDEKEMGVPVKWVRFGSGGDINQAAAADQIDFGNVGNPPASIGITRGLPYQGIFITDVLGPVESLVVRADKNINSLKDLVGKTATAPFGSTTHYLFIAALEKAGIKPTEVKLLDMAPSDAMAAWLRKDIDAAYIWEPVLDKMVKSGGKILLTSGDMAHQGYPTWDVAVVMNRFATKYPTMVAHYVKSQCAAIDYWLKEPQKTAELLAKELNVPVDETMRMINGTEMVPCSKQITADYFGTSGQKGKFVDSLVATATFLKGQNRLPEVKERAVYDKFINPSFIEAVAKP